MKENLALVIDGHQSVFSPEEVARVIKIGRSSGNTIPVVQDNGISKFHCRIFLQSGRPWIEDLQSRNGTFLNDNRIAGPAELSDGDRLVLGNTVIFVHLHTTPSPAGELAWQQAGGFTRIFSIKELEDRWKNPDHTGISSQPALAVAPPPAGPVKPAEPEHPAPPTAKPDPSDSMQTVLNEVRRLGVLQEIASSLLDHNDLDALFQHSLDLIFSVIPASRGCLMMLEEGELQVKACRIKESSPATASPDIIRFSQTIRRLVVEQKSAVLTANVAGDPHLESAQSIIIQGIKSVLCVPLWNGDHIYGLIYLDSPFNEQAFNESNLQLLNALANLVTMKIENMLFIRELLKKKAMEKELEFASDVQRFLIQSNFPELPAMEAGVFYQSCLKLGGDYYHCFPTPDGRFLTVIADVMGKGTGAALLTASLHAYLQAFTAQERDLAKLLGRLNDAIHGLSDGQIFVTLFALLLDPAGLMADYCNAGHNPALLIRTDGQAEPLTEGGVIMGILPGSEFHVKQVPLRPGDLLLLYTDGLTEAENQNGEMFGNERLEQFLAGRRSLSCPELAAALLEEVRKFEDGYPQRDDLTGILIKCTGPEKTC